MSTKIPLSPAQESLWLLEDILPTNGLYNMANTMAWKGPLNSLALQKALDLLIQTHPVLRTTIAIDENGPFGEIQDRATFPLQEFNAQDLNEDELVQKLTAESFRPFHLKHEMPVRAGLWHQSEDSGILLIVVHHIAFDDWSRRLFAQQLSIAYKTFISDNSIAVAPDIKSPEVEYQEFSEWQRSSIDDLAPSRQYWIDHLENSPSTHKLPVDFNVSHTQDRNSQNSDQTRSSALDHFPLSPAIGNALSTFSYENKTTHYITLLAAFRALLHVYGDEDAIIGTPFSNRGYPELEDVVGLFVNALPIRLPTNDDITFSQLCQLTKNTLLDAHEHAHYPFDRIVDDLKTERIADTNPLFQIMFVHQPEGETPWVLEGLQLKPFPLNPTGTRFDLSFTVQERKGDSPIIGISYSPDKFSPNTIERMVRHYCSILEKGFQNPTATLLSLPYLDENEIVDAYIKYNPWDYHSSSPITKTIINRIIDIANQSPDDVAIIFKGEPLTYKELIRTSYKISQKIDSFDLPNQSIIGIYQARRPHFIISALSIWMAGFAFVPLDKGLPASRLETILKSATPNLILTSNILDESDIPNTDETNNDQLIENTHIPLINIAEIEKEETETVAIIPPSRAGKEDLAYILYTSGSTGTPKGVEIRFEQIDRLFDTGRLNIPLSSDRDIWSCTHSLSFDVSIWEIYGCLERGGTLVLLDDEARADGAEVIKTLNKYNVTLLSQTSTAFRSLVEYHQSINKVSLESLKWVIFAGETLDLGAIRSWYEYYRDDSPQLANMYGITEVTVHTTFSKISQDDVKRGPPAQIGAPLQDMRLFILNAKGEPVPYGVPGELWVAGPGLAKGYHKDDVLTAKRFREIDLKPAIKAIENIDKKSLSPAIPSSIRAYKSGDLVKRTIDGRLLYLNRIDNQLKVRGYRVEPSEIENTLQRIKGINTALVTLIQDNENGHDEKLVAFVVLDKEADTKQSVDKSTIGDFVGQILVSLKQQLPCYMVPNRVISCESLPLTNNGKINIQKLKNLYFESKVVENEISHLPETIIQKEIAKIWCRLLDISAVDLYNDFFTLGGHSLLAARFLYQVQQQWNTSISLRVFFSCSILKDFSEFLESKIENKDLNQKSNINVEPVSFHPDMSKGPVTPGQKRLYYLEKATTGKSLYQVPIALRIKGALDIKLLQTALNRLIERHTSLRTRVLPDNSGNLYQKIDPIDEMPFEFIQTMAEETDIAKLIYLPFDLEHEWPIRSHLLEISNGIYILLITAHHIAVDDASMQILIRELNDFYNKKDVSIIPEIRMLDYALYLEQHTDFIEEAVIRRYQYLQDISEEYLVPTDKINAANPTYRGKIIQSLVNPEKTKKLKALAEAESISLNSILLSLYSLAIHRCFSKERLSIGIPISNREKIDFSHLVGFLAETSVVLSDISDNDTFTSFSKRLHTEILNAYTDRYACYDQVLARLKESNEFAKQNRLFNIFFTLTHSNKESQPSFNNLQITAEPFTHDIAKFDLTLSVREEHSNGSLHLRFEYSTEAFEESTIQGVSSVFMNLLNQVIQQDSSAIADLELVSNEIKQNILNEFQGSVIDWTSTQGHGLTIPQILANSVRNHPHSVAFRWMQDGEQITLSYNELNSKVVTVSNEIRKLNLSPDAVIGVALPRGVELWICMLSIMSSSHTYLYLPQSYPDNRIRHIIEDSSATYIFVEENQTKRFEDIIDGTQASCIHFDDFDRQKETQQTENTNESLPVSPDSIAYILYTSGSTGKPKGVCIRHEAVCNLGLAQLSLFDVSPNSCILQFANPGFDSSVAEWITAIAGGASIFIPTGPQDKIIEETISILGQNEVTVATFPPSVLKAIPEELINRLKTLAVAGEACPVNVWKQWVSKPNLRFINAYGPTESTVVGAAYICDEQHPFDSIGKPLANQEAYVTNLWGQLLPPGLTGEISLGGIGVAKEYLNQANLTSEKFVKNIYNPKSAYDRIYISGDRARWLADGTLQFKGRLDDQIKLRGQRIEPGEIESLLLTHQSVQQAAVVVSRFDNKAEQLIAFISTHHDTKEISRRVMEYAQRHLPHFMVPSRIEVLDSLPITHHGKVNRKLLQSLANQSEPTEEYIAPTNKIEESICQALQQSLQIHSTSMSDTFFSIGGDSISAIIFVSELRKLGFKLDISQIFITPNLAELSSYAQPIAESESEQDLERKNQACLAEGTIPLLPSQDWFFRLGLPLPNHWNQSQIRLCEPTINLDHLQTALFELQKRHPMLRSKFAPFTVQTQCHITSPPESYALKILRGTDDPTTVLSKIHAELDIVIGPVFKAIIYQYTYEEDNKEDIILGLFVHHLAIDTYSWRVIWNELTIIYNELLCNGKKRPGHSQLGIDHIDQWSLYLSKKELYSENAASNPGIFEEAQSYPAITLDTNTSSNKQPLEKETIIHDILSKIDNTENTDKFTKQAHEILKRFPYINTEVLILTALTSALHLCNDCSKFHILLEDNGRDNHDHNLDPSSTIGWLGTYYPFPVNFSETTDILEKFEHIRNTRLSIQENGVDYLVNKQRNQSETIDAGTDTGGVWFNYLGGSPNAKTKSTSMFHASPYSSGFSRSPENPRVPDIELLSYWSESKLNIQIVYSPKQFNDESIQKLSQTIYSELLALTDAISSTQQSLLNIADLPFCPLTQKQFKTLQNQHQEYQIEDVFPLTPMQNGMLWSALGGASSSTHIAQNLFTVPAFVNTAAIKRAFEYLMLIYDNLRTGFSWKDLEQPVQYVCKQVDLPWKHRFIDSSDAETISRLLKEVIDEGANEGIDLSRPPFFRLMLIENKSDPQRYLLWNQHHAVCDGWSISKITQTFSIILNALVHENDNDTQDIDELLNKIAKPPSFRHYVQWLNGTNTQEAKDLWTQSLGDITNASSLSKAYGHQCIPNSEQLTAQQYKSYELFIDKNISDQTKELAKQLHVSHSAVLLSVFSVFLSRNLDQDDVCFGITSSGRAIPLANSENIIGSLIHTVPIRMQIDQAHSWHDVIRLTHEKLSKLPEMESLPLNEIQKLSGIPARTALFDVLCVVQNLAEWSTDNRFLLERIDGTERAEYPLGVIILPGNSIKLIWKYQTNLFDAETIARFASSYEQLLLAMLSLPEGTHNQSESLSVSQLNKLKELGNVNLIRTKEEHKNNKPVKLIHEMIFETAALYPDQYAIIQANKTWTYKETAHYASQLSHWLIQQGIRKNSIVTIILPRSFELFASIIACLTAGAAYLVIDPNQNESRIEQRLQEIQSPVIITNTEIEDELPVFDGLVFLIDEDQALLTAFPTTPVQSDISLDDTAYCIYTSGTSGRPKGVLVKHHGIPLLAQSQSSAFGIQPGTKVLQLASITFDASVSEWSTTLSQGGCLVLPTQQEAGLDPTELAAMTVEVATVPPSILSILPEDAFPALKTLIVAGEACAPGLLKPWRNRVRVINAYGPTESTVCASLIELTEKLPANCIGKPLDHIEIMLLDHHKRLLPEGAVGEIYLSGPALAKNYLNRPEEQEKAFVSHPIPDSRYDVAYRTGDFGRWREDGCLEFLGRRDSQVKIRGHRIELAEVENILAQFSLVKQVAVTSKILGNQNTLLSYITLIEHCDLSKEEALGSINEYVSTAMPGHLRPAHIIIMDALPKTSNGKIDIDALPIPELYSSNKVQEPYQNKLEEKIGTLLGQVLSQSPLQRSDDFFKFGGDSIKCMAFVVLAHKEGINIELRDVLESPIPAELAKKVGSSSSSKNKTRPQLTKRLRK